MFSDSALKKIGIFAGGVLFGTAGVKLLTSKDAKRVYTNCTAAVLRAKECVMETAEAVQENAEDILAEAQLINESGPKRRPCRFREGCSKMPVRKSRKRRNKEKTNKKN